MELTTASPEVRRALEFAARYGWNVFPVNAEDKRPAVKGWQALASADPVVWASWWSEDGSHPSTLVGVATGPDSGVWAFDVDPKNGGADSFADLSVAHDHLWGAPLVVSTPSGGRHHLYAYPPPEVLAEFGADRIKNRQSVRPGIDIRGQGGLVVCPGPDGRRPLDSPPAELGAAPHWLLELVLTEDGVGDGADTAGSSRLSDLLDNPPTGTGARNGWLARVAGHFAAEFDYEDRYLAQVRMANRSLPVPLDDDEVEKTARSIWKTELQKAKIRHPGGLHLPEYLVRAANALPAGSKGEDGADAPGAVDEVAEAATALGLESGGLRPVRRGGERTGRLQVDVFVRVGDKQVRQPAEWAAFDLVATGVTDDEDEERLYQVTLIRGRDGRQIEAILPAATLADRRKLNAWLFRYGVSIIDPPNPVQRLGACERLQNYLEAQGPPVFELVRHLGYSDSAKAFVTAEGIVTADGLEPLGRFRLHPDVARSTRGQFHYGHGAGPEQVREVLREILTFHHETEAAVFGAWWAATLLKHVAVRHSSLFPFMAIEAPSESGKTTGMFGMLIELSGWTGGQATYTKASFRDALTLNRNGIIWLDDPDSVEHLEEVLRAATAEGTMTKKAEDLALNQGARLVAPVVVSGEHLGFREEKALRDRAIHLEVRSPTDRRSLRDPSQPQYNDLKRLRNEHPDLGEFAGTLVRMALGYAEEFADDVRALRGRSGRRVGDAVAILQAGAGLLDRLTGDGHWADVVGHWMDENGIEDTGAENALTLKVLPELLAVVGRRAEPSRLGSRYDMATPVLVRPTAGGAAREVWVNARLCAMWWDRLRNGRIERRVESATAFQQQLKALGATEKARFRVDKLNEDKPWYVRLPDQVAETVLARN